MASRRRTKPRRRPHRGLRWLWSTLQALVVLAGILLVALYVSRLLPPVHKEPNREKAASHPSTRSAPGAPAAKAHTTSAPTGKVGDAIQPPLSLPSDHASDVLSPSPVSLKVSSREVDVGATSSKLVALTFDAGSSAEPVPSILRTLAQRSLRCTFFLTGQWIERYPEMARQIADAGHELGNHSWSHPAFTSLTEAQISEQLQRTEEIALRVCGRSTKPLFRPPFGARDERVRLVVAQEGYVTIYWTVDSWDSVKKGITPQMITDRVMRLIRPGAIVLMHCGSEATAQALPQLLNSLDAEGYRVVTVGELLYASNRR